MTKKQKVRNNKHKRNFCFNCNKQVYEKKKGFCPYCKRPLRSQFHRKQNELNQFPMETKGL